MVRRYKYAHPDICADRLTTEECREWLIAAVHRFKTRTFDPLSKAKDENAVACKELELISEHTKRLHLQCQLALGKQRWRWSKMVQAEDEAELQPSLQQSDV